jgi:7-cyano-7-deazaguanine tRNA-ribosyltransferase
MRFEIKDRDAAGRICKLTTEHGTFLTPTLMPVINPNKVLITPKEMKKLFGTEIVITNSYIIKKDKNLTKKALKDGVHKLINFNGPIMTDSGTFQSYIYGDINVEPTEIVEFQRDIGSDIGTILDVFGLPDQTKKEAVKGVNETIKRAKQASKIKRKMNLACTVQGSIYADLRERCAKELSDINADFYPIGGVVPFMENQRYLDLTQIILSSKKGLDPSKPVHLFGAGHPLIFPLAVALGCDLFDSSAYVKYANDNRMIFYWGTEKLDDLTELPCSCPVCSKYTADELKKIDKKQRTLEIAKHNLYVSFEEIKKIRNAISNGNLWELVERRANSNPYLLESLKLLRTQDTKKFLEQFEPVSKKKALFYTGCNTIHRPIIYRTRKRLLERYKPVFKTTVVFPEGGKPYSKFYFKEIKDIFKKNSSVNILVDSYLGPVPLELDEMYPFAQSVFPEFVDKETEENISEIFDGFIDKKNLICWRGKQTLNEIDENKKSNSDLDRQRVSAVCDMQFGKNASKALLNGTLKLVKSKKTEKIRNVYNNEKHVLSMRANDGLFTLKIDGAIMLHKYFKFPKMRVIVKDDAVPFIKDGKSVFSKFVEDCDPDLRPFDECLVVDKKDNLLAVGRCLLNRTEMHSFMHGMAVKNRENID